MFHRYRFGQLSQTLQRLAMSIPQPALWRRLTSPSRIWARIGKRFGIGHRAAFLLMFGLIFCILGIGVVLSPSPPNPLLFHTQLPTPVRVTLWCGSGLIAIASARSSYQWVGFVALAPPAIERTLSYLSAIVIDMLPGGGSPIPWPYLNGAVLYLLVLFVTRLVASWPDPPGDDPI